MSSDEDQALMGRIAGGDEAALRALAERHLGRMLRLAEKMLGSAADADDAAQEALMRVWSHAGRWNPAKARLTTWLYAIVYRLCVDRLRQPRPAPLAEEWDAEDPAPNAEDGLVQADELKRLSAAMGRLPERQRAALALFYYEELSGPDAALVMGLSLRAFWSLLHRARLTIHETLISDGMDADDPR